MNEMELARGQRPARLLPTPGEKQHNRAIEAIVNEARERGLQIEASAALTSKGMECTADLWNLKKNLAGDDPELDMALRHLVGGFVDAAGRLQRGYGRGFKL